MVKSVESAFVSAAALARVVRRIVLAVLLAAAMACTGQRGFAAAVIGVPARIAPYAKPMAGRPMSRAQLLACLDTAAVRALK